jgi:hypothetical protein
MKFDTKNAGTWFLFNEEDVSEGRICLRICAGKDIDNINKLSKKTTVEYRKGQRFEVQNVNNELYQKLLWDFCIVDWENVQELDGALIPCNAENKIRMMNTCNMFAAFVIDALDKIDKVNQKEAEDELKNS